jgi:hypothetical protein
MNQIVDNLCKSVLSYRNLKEKNSMSKNDFLTKVSGKDDISYYRQIYLYLIWLHLPGTTTQKEMMKLSGLYFTRVYYSRVIKNIRGYILNKDKKVLNDFEEIKKIFQGITNSNELQEKLKAIWLECYNTHLEDEYPEFYSKLL